MIKFKIKIVKQSQRQ